MRSNFSFVKTRDPELFQMLLDIERKVKIDPYGIGNTLRQALEMLCARRIAEYKLKDELLQEYRKTRNSSPNSFPSLNDQLNYLRCGSAFLENYRRCTGVNVPGMPSFSIDLAYDTENGRKESRFESHVSNTGKYRYADSFLRQLGNDYSHSNNPYFSRVFKKSYRNVLDALICLRKYICLYYSMNEKDLPAFDEDLMPILNYSITSAREPSDIGRSLCRREFTADRYEDYRSDCVGTSVIRQYNRSADDVLYLRRAPEVYLAGDNCGSLLKQVTILSEGGHEDRPFYIIAYDFRTHAEVLNEAFLKTLSVKERLQLCLTYAETMRKFHKNPVPIYHRVFTCECAYYADERESGRGIDAAIIKFEFAKIADDRFKTVIGSSSERARQISKTEERYLAPEWNVIGSLDAPDWAKADIYSLGILFADIFMQKIGGYEIRALAAVSDIKQYIGLLGEMLSSIAQRRPDIDSVCDKLKGWIENA